MKAVVDKASESDEKEPAKLAEGRDFSAGPKVKGEELLSRTEKPVNRLRSCDPSIWIG